MNKPTLKHLIKEEIKNILSEAQSPSYKSKHKNNNLVAAIYFSWAMNANNNPTLWTDVIEAIEKNDCILINYVVTDSVCEFEFKPYTVGISQDLLEEVKYGVEDSLEPIVSRKATGYDVYIVGN